MKNWKKITNLKDILTEEGWIVYSNSDYYVFKNVNTELYRITIHDNPYENIVNDNMYESDVEYFFTSMYEENYLY